ncbi:Transcriptional regulator of competence genes, TfoX/Sxy family [Chitinophaga sp. CF118]|uniref:TfoX/Sxy family protein n=1 Tax=Chitinophaga sp. CF118 TaxID=1884367 RepID=UPI0008DF3D35|nr:TfoX/Sxy family protein [Chitinophaga sp. CF118]SFE16498.1 Transcriptional regulator of competence genes, TfoX/Sxy family [Chitinophaga sp. CF118]
MSYNEQLADRVREAVAGAGDIEEKKMFGGMCFMVNGKMCICVRDEEIMCRISPEDYAASIEKTGCRPMIHGGKTMIGYIYVNEDAIRTKKEFDYWVKTSLAFNKDAKAAKPKKKKN